MPGRPFAQPTDHDRKRNETLRAHINACTDAYNALHSAIARRDGAPCLLT